MNTSHTVTLTPFMLDNWKQLSDWIPDERALVQFAGDIFTHPITQEQILTYLNDDKRHAFCAMYNNTIIGHGEIYCENGQTAKLCRILIGENKYRGQGLGQQLTQALSAHAFDVLGVERVHLNVFDWNKNAIECYKKSGFAINPEKTQAIIVQGEQWHTVNMVMTHTKR